MTGVELRVIFDIAYIYNCRVKETSNLFWSNIKVSIMFEEFIVVRYFLAIKVVLLYEDIE